MSERLTALERQRMRATEARAAAKRAVPTGRDLPLERLPGLYDPRNEHDSCGVGFVADLKGARSHDIIAKGLQILENLTHRGAVGADPLVGDGAGLLSQIPHEFFSAECAALGFELPARGDYGVGYLFMPRDETLRGALRGDRRAGHRRRRPEVPRLAHRADRQFVASRRARRSRRASPSTGRPSSAAARRPSRATPSSAASSSCAR